MATPDLRNIRVIGFDLDQTLYPKSPAVDARIQEYLYEKIAVTRRVSRDEAERLFAKRYRGGAGLTGSQTLRDLGIPDADEVVQEALERADIASLLTPDKETNRLLSEVCEHYEGMDLITGSNRVQMEKKLQALGLSPQLFSNLITADDATKSDGSAYRLWLARYPALVPDQFLYVGDRIRSDHEIPSTLGIRTALVYVDATDPALTALQAKDLKEVRLLLLS